MTDKFLSINDLSSTTYVQDALDGAATKLRAFLVLIAPETGDEIYNQLNIKETSASILSILDLVDLARWTLLMSHKDVKFTQITDERTPQNLKNDIPIISEVVTEQNQNLDLQSTDADPEIGKLYEDKPHVAEAKYTEIKPEADAIPTVNNDHLYQVMDDEDCLELLNQSCNTFTPIKPKRSLVHQTNCNLGPPSQLNITAAINQQLEPPCQNLEHVKVDPVHLSPLGDTDDKYDDIEVSFGSTFDYNSLPLTNENKSFPSENKANTKRYHRVTDVSGHNNTLCLKHLQDTYPAHLNPFGDDEDNVHVDDIFGLHDDINGISYKKQKQSKWKSLKSELKEFKHFMVRPFLSCLGRKTKTLVE